MNIPTKITISRIVIVGLMLIGLFALQVVNFFIPTLVFPNIGDTKINLIYLIITIIFVIGAITDKIDGDLARKWNQVTDLGKFLDPIADKLLIDGIFIFLLVPPSYAPNQMAFPLFCAIIFIARDLIVDALRLIAVQKNQVIAANIFGKLKTVLQMIAIPAILLNDWPFSYFDGPLAAYHFSIAEILVYIATLASLLSGIIYVWQNRNVLKEVKK